MALSTRKRGALVIALTRAVRAFIAGSSIYSIRVAERLDLHATDLQFLNLLDLFGPLTPGELSRYSGLSTGGVTVVLDRLERIGFIRRKRSTADRRSVTVEIPAGRRARIASNYDAIQAQFTGLLAEFTSTDLELLLRFFTTMNQTERP
jgi:MarR family transcriptional regulator, organic hydroperoxide resistance regulator